MDISINIESVLKYKLTINEYIYLRDLYVDNKDKIDELYSLIDNINEDSLQDRGFIKITEDSIILRQKTIEMFEPLDLFYKFLSTFPIKTPSGRYLSPARVDGIAVKKLKKKWESLFKNNNVLEARAIEVLEAELKWRRNSGNLEYINAMEAWLNGANYEKYEYLLDLQNSSTSTDKWL